jgi:PAS domain S-box-containing protein
MLIADDARRYVDANPAASRLLGIPREQILTMSIDDVMPPEYRDRLDDHWQEFLHTGMEAGPIEIMLPSGERMHVEYSATANVVPGRHLSILFAGRYDELDGNGSERPELLTRREREVLEQVALGASTREIGRALGMSPDTARTHAQNAMRKLGARTRAHAVALAVKHNLIRV